MNKNKLKHKGNHNVPYGGQFYIRIKHVHCESLGEFIRFKNFMKTVIENISFHFTNQN